MAKTTVHHSEPPPTLKDPEFSAVLAWLWPGLGHLYQGRAAKGWLYMSCILGLFLYGLYLGQGRVVFVYSDSYKPEYFRWPYLCQVCAGLPALPAVIQKVRGAEEQGPPLAFGNWYKPPADEAQLNDLHRVLHRNFELGTVFTMIAGLLNVLAIYDAWCGPAYDTQKASKEEEEPAQAAA